MFETVTRQQPWQQLNGTQQLCVRQMRREKCSYCRHVDSMDTLLNKQRLFNFRAREMKAKS